MAGTQYVSASYLDRHSRSGHSHAHASYYPEPGVSRVPQLEILREEKRPSWHAWLGVVLVLRRGRNRRSELRRNPVRRGRPVPCRLGLRPESFHRSAARGNVDWQSWWLILETMLSPHSSSCTDGGWTQILLGGDFDVVLNFRIHSAFDIKIDSG
jgi:hypothetical protein